MHMSIDMHICIIITRAKLCIMRRLLSEMVFEFVAILAQAKTNVNKNISQKVYKFSLNIR